MQFSIFAIALSLGLASSAALPNAEAGISDISKRACFKTGAGWGNDIATALLKAEDASKMWEGFYNSGQTVYACYNLSGSKRVNFEFGLRNDRSSRSITWQDIYGGLSAEIDSCGKGGATTHNIWYYRADPNTEGGLC